MKIHLLKILPIVFFFATTNIISQVKVDTLQASRYYQKADSLLVDRKMDSSIVYFQKALPLYEKAKAWGKVVNCYNKMAVNYRNNRELDKSFQNCTKALQITTKYLEENHEEKAITYDNFGHYYLQIPEYEKAETYFKKSLEIRQKIFSEDHHKIAISYKNLGDVSYYKGLYKIALNYFQKSLEINRKTLGPNHPDTARSYNSVGVAYDVLGQPQKALAYYLNYLDFNLEHFGENHLRTGFSYGNLGVIYIVLNQYERALTYVEKSLPIFKSYDHKRALSMAYNNLQIIYKNRGEHDKGLQYAKKSIEIKIEIYGENHPSLVATYLNIGGNFLLKKNYEQALFFYQKGLDLNKKIFKRPHEKTANALNEIGKVYSFQGDYVKALQYMQRALDEIKKVFEEDNSRIALSYSYIADLYKKMGMHDKALSFYEVALNINKKIYGENALPNTAIYNSIAEMYCELGLYKKAILYFDKALLSNSYKNTNGTQRKNNLHTTHVNTELYLLTLKGKSQALQWIYTKTRDKSILNQSISLYKTAEVIIDEFQKSSRKYQDKLTFSEQSKDIYFDAIKASLSLYKESNDSKNTEMAFFFAEKSKSNILKALLNNSYAKKFTGLPAKHLEIEKDLKTYRAFYQSKVIEEQSKVSIDSIKVKEFENELFAIDRKQDSLLKTLENEYPNYYQLKHENTVISISEIQRSLSDETTILEFVTADSLSYAFTISKNNFEVSELSTPQLSETINELKNTILDKDLKNYKNLSFELYQTLIEPVKNKLTGGELIIIPDGSLWHLNFDLLLTANSTSNDPKDLPYLMEEYAISYANSATLLIHPFPFQKPAEKLKECLAFSFSDSTTMLNTAKMSLATLRDTGDDLPGTRKEIKAISEIVEGQYFYGSEAIEANFKKNASEYNILHLALHGEVNNERPEQSRLYFTKSKDTVEDNYLYAHELFALDIPAELTVLSACNTGSGKIAKGEGIMSLGNAFQYAGTKSLLLTNWEVSDETTPQLMKNFYTNLKEGMSKSKALQQAKLQYIQTADAQRTSPFYWGGFYLVGDTKPIEFTNETKYYWIAGIGLVIILLGGLFWYRNKTKAA